MESKEVLKLFEQHGALLKGHFKLSSGLHSDTYLQCALILQYPGIAEKMAKSIADGFSEAKIDVVVGPALGGVTLAYEVARALKVRGIFTERQPSASPGCLPGPVEGRQDSKMVLRRGFDIKRGERALVVEDVITTGGSTKEVIDVVRSLGGVVAGVGSIIDRSSAAVDFGVASRSLAKVSAQTYEEKQCPLCGQGIPVTKPGSRR